MKVAHRIAEKLHACRPYYEELVLLRDATTKRDLSSIEWAALERFLQLALECALDVGDMIIAWKKLPRAQANKDVFRILGESNVLDPELAARLVPAAKLRNLLVHGYGEIDRDQLKRELRADLRDLDEYALQVSRYLKAEQGAGDP